MPAHTDGMPIWYHPIYTEGIHPDARFPRERYVELIKRLKSLRNSNKFLFLEPNKASRSELVIGHDPYYVDNLSLIHI